MKDKLTKDEIIKCILISWGMGFVVGITIAYMLWR